MKRRNKKRNRTLSFETLENRELMAAGILQSGQELLISGSDQSDSGYVSYVGNYVKASLNGNAEYFRASGVEQIRFSGHSGNDKFVNNTNIQSVQSGGSGNDTLIGGNAGDWLSGGSGNDVLEGRRGDDLLQGDSGHDRYVFSGSKLGSDHITGSTNGENTLDLRKRGGGNRVDLRSTGSQVVRSGNLNLKFDSMYAIDHVFGSDYGDEIIGNSLANNIYGNGGNDVIYGSSGRDYIRGGSGDDRLSGNDGSDRLFGDSGNDVLIGGAHHDTIDGGSGRDQLFGQSGNDNLYGGSGDDQLVGGSGNDGLFGGNGYDEMWGQSGADRFLARSGYKIHDYSSSDAIVRFLPGTGGQWNDLEIKQLDKALQFFHQRTGNTRFLKDTISVAPLKIYKAAQNNVWNGQNIGNSATGRREIHLVDFNANDQKESNARISTLVHEIAHNWEDEGPEWNQFLGLSGWTQRYPGSTHYMSTDGRWFYRKGSTFARNYGQSNPKEDFATAMQKYYDVYQKYGQAGIYQSPGARTGIQHKLKMIDKLFEIYEA